MATRARWGGLRPDPYNPDAFDADGDGIVQEGTAFERPASTVIVDGAGNPIQANLRSNTRPQDWRIVDRNTGRVVPYVPSYQRAPSQPIANRVGTVGGRVGTLKDMVGTIGDRIPILEQAVGTIVSSPEPRRTPDFANQFSNSDDLGFLLGMELPDFEEYGIKHVDAKNVMRGGNDVVQNVEAEFGRISTAGDAIRALREALPMLVEDPFFLTSEDPTSDLTPNARGVVYGYLQMTLDIPEVKSFPVLFEQSESGGHMDMSIVTKDDKLRSDKPALHFGVNVYNVAQPTIAMAAASGGMSLEGTVDGVVSQAMFSYAYDNPEGFDSPSEVFDSADFHAGVYVALHESAHAADSLAQLKDAFGLDATVDEIRGIVKQMVDADGVKSFLRHRFAGLFLDVPVLVNKTIPFLNRVSAAIEKAENEIRDEFISIFGAEPGEEEEAQIKKDAFLAVMFNDSSDLPFGFSPFGQYFSTNIEPIMNWEYDPNENPTNPDRRKVHVAKELTGDDVKSRLRTLEHGSKQIHDILSNPKYAPLVDDLELEEFMIRMGEREMLASPGTDPQEAVIGSYSPTVAYRTIAKHQDLVLDFLDEYSGEEIRATLESEFSTEEEIVRAGFAYSLAIFQMDDLSGDEVDVLRSFGDTISEYAGDYEMGFYQNFYMSNPVESVAEIRAAMSMRRFPQEGTPEYLAVKKLFVWLYGLGFWNKMEFNYG